MKSIAKGSIYQIDIETIGKGIVISQDNGQEVVIHAEDMKELADYLYKQLEG